MYLNNVTYVICVGELRCVLLQALTEMLTNVCSHFRLKGLSHYNNIYLLQFGCYPVAAVISHVYKT